MTNITQLKNLAMKEKEAEAREIRNRATRGMMEKVRQMAETPPPVIEENDGHSNTPRSNSTRARKEREDFKRDDAPHIPHTPADRRNTPLPEAAEPEEIKPKKPSILKKLHDFDFNINKENAPKFLPFILYISCWVILYIANHHYGEKTLLQIDRTNREMKDLKADYYTSNAELSNKSIQSKVLDMVDTLGLKELRTPPHRLKLIKEEK